MRYLTNKSSSEKLTLVLHGVFGNLNQPLVKTIFENLKSSKDKIVAFEYGYVELGTSFDPDQATEAKEVELFIKKHPHKELTVISHSNSNFVTLLLWQWGIPIKKLILLGLGPMRDPQTRIEMSDMIRDVNKRGKVYIIQAEEDEYAKPNIIKSFLKEKGLKMRLIELSGDHHYKGSEKNLAKKVKQILSKNN